MNKLGLQHTIHVHVTTLACIFLVVNCLEKSGTYRRNEEDGLEGNLAFCSEMDFSKRIFWFLRMNRKYMERFNLC